MRTKLVIFDQQSFPDGPRRERGIILEGKNSAGQKIKLKHKLTRANALQLLALVVDIITRR